MIDGIGGGALTFGFGAIVTKFSELTQDHALSPVPKAQTVSGWQIALVKIGVVLALPAFISGAKIGYSMGLTKGCLAFLAGGLILAIIASLTGSIGAKSGLSTAMITRFAFGKRGAHIVNLILAVSLMGWFGVTVDLFGKTLNNTINNLFSMDIGKSAYIVFGGIIMIATTVFGFRALQRLSDALVPLMILGLCWVCYLSLEDVNVGLLLSSGTGELRLGLAISAVVGGMVVGTTIFPDLSRFAHNSYHSKLAAFTCYGVAAPFILAFAAIPSLVSGEDDLILIMLSLGLGVSALLLLVFTAWTTNAGNLYSSTLAFKTLLVKSDKWKITLMLGMTGSVLAILGITSQFISFLIILGVTIPPVAGIYIADFYFVKHQTYTVERMDNLPDYCLPAFFAWTAASAIGYATSKDAFVLTTIPACDSAIMAFTIYYAQFKWLFLREQKLANSTSCR